jgi:HEAT repeat protein
MRFILCVFALTAHGLAAAESSAWQMLAEGAADENGYKRAPAIVALGTIQTPEADKLIAAALGDKEVFVRFAAVNALAERKSRADIPKLKTALDDESGEVSFTAAKALWELGDRSGREILEEVLAGELKQSPGFVRSQIRDAKSTMHNRKALVWMGAKEGVGFLFGPLGTGLGVMEQVMKDGSAPARALSATLLARDKDSRAIADLGNALYDKNPLVRAAAAKSLGGFSSPTVRPKLEVLLEDKSDAVRYMAAASIVRIDRSRSRGKGQIKQKTNDARKQSGAA